jgi:hypothetical protein
MTGDPTHTIGRFTTDVGAAVDFLAYTRQPFYSRKHLDWKIARNPFGPAASYLRHRDGVAAAHTSIVPKPANDALLSGVTLGELGDTHTHPNFQRQGHFAALGKHVIEDFESRSDAKHVLIYGLPNAQALPGWTRSIGCKVMERLDITDMSRYPWRGLRSSFLGRVGRIFRRGPRLAIAVTDPRSDIDEIWANSDQARWLIRKDARWWEWRYNASPDRYSTHVLRDRRDSSARAWIVSRSLPTRVPGVRRVAIGDVVGRTTADEVLAFKRFMVSVPRLTDIVQIWFQKGSSLAPAVGAFGFQAVRQVPVIFADNEAYNVVTTSPSRFQLSLGDTDNI